jgi:hypothetical protein
MRLLGVGDVRGLGGLGSTWPSSTPEVAACGASPCTWWDNVYARDACVEYMKCAIPSDPTTVYLDQGVGAGVGAEVGSVGGGAVSGAVQGLAGLSPSTLMLIGAAIGLVIVFRR